MNPAGLLFDSSYHYLDHIAPFCALLNWPLLISDPALRECAEKLYPDLTIISTPNPPHLGPWITKRFSHIVSCSPRFFLQELFTPQKLPNTLWLPHGNSDKGQIRPYYRALYGEETILVYGQKMIDFFKQGALCESRMICIGAYRKRYFETMHHRTICALPTFQQPNQPLLLYAPTWDDWEQNGTFFTAFESIAHYLPKSINLLVKLHPNTWLKKRPFIESWIGKYTTENLRFLEEDLPIYPLLSQCSALLSDRSSIGYDFLFFNRPLFFLDPHRKKRGRDLLSCGEIISPKSLFQIDWKQSSARFAKKREEMARYTFGPTTALEELPYSLFTHKRR